MTDRIIAFVTPAKHQGETLTVGREDLPGSCYLVTGEVADFFTDSMGWAVEAPGAADPVDMTRLSIEPGTRRVSDGLIVKPADVSVQGE